MNNVKFNKNFTIATVSKEFKENMYQYGTEAHKLMMEIRQIYPNITFRVASNRVSSNAKLTYARMKVHLEAKVEAAASAEEKDAIAKLIKEFDKIQKLSKIQRNPYRYVLNWFKGVCPELFPQNEENNNEEMAA